MAGEMQRDFKGVWIPREVWLDERLNALDKVILVEIDSLDRSERGCYASNKHLADFCQCSESKVSRAISKLIKLGYVYIQSFNGRQRELKSRLSNFASLPVKKSKADYEKLQESNTDNNTTNKTDRNILYVSEIVDYLNEKAGTNYRHKNKKTQSLINARFNDGFTVDDFKTVIDIKCSKWKGTNMADYLRPETLFGTKFESYLNEKTEGVKNNATDKKVNTYGNIGTVL